MAQYYIARDEELKKEFDENGFAMTEVLPGTYQGGIKNYKCWLKAGSEIAPQLLADKMVVIMFGKGKGYIYSDSRMDRITEPSFYVPDFNKETYKIHALDDMEFMYCVVEMNIWDWEVYHAGHVRVPFFMKYSDGIIYDQDCKGSHTTSWSILHFEQMGRIMLGVVRAVGEGTVEKGHSKVEQWNYCLGNADFTLKAGDADPVRHKAGEWSYIPAGVDYSLVADEGKEVFYVWFEHFTRERDFVVTLAEGEKLEDKLKH